MGVNMKEKSLLNEQLKLTYIINDFFGCDAMYYDVNSFDLAKHLLDNGITLSEKAEPAKEEKIELDENVITEIALSLCSFYKKDCSRCPDCWARDKAKKFYRQGYRKLINAYWIYTEFALDNCDLMCSNCGCAVFNVVNPPYFCSSCGAKMSRFIKTMGE